MYTGHESFKLKFAIQKSDPHLYYRNVLLDTLTVKNYVDLGQVEYFGIQIHW